MKPSAVRARILREHGEIRALVAALERAVARLRAGEAAAAGEARAACDALCTWLVDHIDLEDAILAPALRDADAWGPERERQLLEHHREQRAELRALGETEALEPAALCERLEALIAELHADMKHEEEALLDPDLLRDDVIGIDVTDG